MDLSIASVSLPIAVVSSTSGKTVPKKRNGETVKKEGDMLFKKEVWQEIEQRNKNPGWFGGGAVTKRWTNRVVPYYVSYHFSSQQEQMIRSAIRDYNRKTCLFFRPARYGDRNRHGNYIRFQRGRGCSSYVGMIGGAQPLNLYHGNRGSCFKKGIILHELAHALGVFHEQSRPDRDSYVKVLTSNIQPGKESNFEKFSSSVIDTYGLPYDYLSVMHYGKSAFAKIRGSVTIQTLDPKYQDEIGQREGLSASDVQLINYMYRCRGKYSEQKPLEPSRTD